MDLADYKVVYGEPVPVKNAFHRCFICQTIFVFTRSRLAGHIVRHKISVRDYGKKYLTKVKTERNFTNNLTVGEIDTDCMFSNDYEDECQTICRICDKNLAKFVAKHSVGFVTKILQTFVANKKTNLAR